jgi:hypothetical protein
MSWFAFDRQHCCHQFIHPFISPYRGACLPTSPTTPSPTPRQASYHSGNRVIVSSKAFTCIRGDHQRKWRNPGKCPPVRPVPQPPSRRVILPFNPFTKCSSLHRTLHGALATTTSPAKPRLNLQQNRLSSTILKRAQVQFSYHFASENTASPYP